MGKIYIDSKGKSKTVDLPKFGEIRISVQDGVVVMVEINEKEKWNKE